MFMVHWEKVRKSSQAERDLLHEHMRPNDDDNTYTIDEETLTELENELSTEEKKQFARLLKSLHKLVEKCTEVFIIIT